MRQTQVMRSKYESDALIKNIINGCIYQRGEAILPVYGLVKKLQNKGYPEDLLVFIQTTLNKRFSKYESNQVNYKTWKREISEFLQIV